MANQDGYVPVRVGEDTWRVLPGSIAEAMALYAAGRVDRELQAARILRSPLSGPSARFDAERTLTDLGWTPLAIRLAKGQDIGPVPAESEA
jgi:hypothetical protein